MKSYIKKNLKLIVAVTAILFCVCGLIVTNELRAQILPVASENLKVVYCEVENEVCEYTGKEIKNEIHRIVFADKDGNRIVTYKDDFKINKYIDNIEVGQASIEVTVKGYQESIVIKNAFAIQPARATAPKVSNATRTFIDLTWNEVIGADGYLLYKSKDNGETFMPIKEAKAGKALIYTDKDVALNEVYFYYVRAYEELEDGVVFGNPSEIFKIYTPLDNPTITNVKNAAHDTLQVEWAIVNGATGYQVYRSDKADGEYTLLAEVTDSMAMSYADTTCECGKVYYYYIRVCQQTDNETVYGTASEVSSGKTTPNKTKLSGVTSDNDTKVSLSWEKVPGAQGYEVYKNNQLVQTIENADVLTWEETGLEKEADISYKVRGYCVINNQKLYGLFSSAYDKDITIIYKYTGGSPELEPIAQYQGHQYVYGGTSPTNGWDCSGFTQYAFSKHFGISLPRTAAEQAGGGTTVSKANRAEWKPGDLIFYKEKGKISHVAIYLGNGQMIHALSEKYDTLIQDVDFYEKWDTKTSMYCVKRYLK